MNRDSFQIMLLDDFINPIGYGGMLHILIFVGGKYHLCRSHSIKAKFQIFFAPFFKNFQGNLINGSLVLIQK